MPDTDVLSNWADYLQVNESFLLWEKIVANLATL